MVQMRLSEPTTLASDACSLACLFVSLLRVPIAGLALLGRVPREEEVTRWWWPQDAVRGSASCDCQR